MFLNFSLFPLYIAIIKCFFFQTWGDYANISQAVAIYVTFASEVLLICWFGDQLTQHVRVNGLLLLLCFD